MVITIFGASGKVGRLVVAEALSRGHTVTAFVHSHAKALRSLEEGTAGKLRIYSGDIHDSKSVADSLTGSKAVLSTLGSWHTKSKDIVSAGMETIVPAMQQQGIHRIVSLTGSDAAAPGDSATTARSLTHGLARLAAGKILLDGERHIAILSKSGLDWTVLRAPVMTNSPEIFYRLTLQPGAPWQTIPRRAVAKALLDQIDGAGYANAAPFIYRQKSRFS